MYLQMRQHLASTTRMDTTLLPPPDHFVDVNNMINLQYCFAVNKYNFNFLIHVDILLLLWFPINTR
jgi:hypothetical protein